MKKYEKPELILQPVLSKDVMINSATDDLFNDGYDWMNLDGGAYL